VIFLVNIKDIANVGVIIIVCGFRNFETLFGQKSQPINNMITCHVGSRTSADMSYCITVTRFIWPFSLKNTWQLFPLVRFIFILISDRSSHFEDFLSLRSRRRWRPASYGCPRSVRQGVWTQKTIFLNVFVIFKIYFTWKSI
jgi:hypothetical protein